MKDKKSMVIYPSFRDLTYIKTHRNVLSYFLSIYLSKYFKIIQSYSMQEAKDDLIKSDKDFFNSKIFKSFSTIEKTICYSGEAGIDYFLLTAQSGIRKVSENAFKIIKKRYPKMKLCSPHDHWGSKSYKEDFLFIARELPNEQTKNKLISSSYNSKIKPIYTGWCADHKILKREENKNIGIVLDHAALQDFRKDLTDKYLKYIKIAKKANPNIQLCRIKGGFEFYDFSKNIWTRDEGLRWWKEDLPEEKTIKNGEGATIFQIAKCLNNSRFFCITHVESCGLTAIEALMAGCKIYIPRGKDKYISWAKGGQKISDYNGAFIKQDLLKNYMDYRIFNEDADISTLLTKDIKSASIPHKRRELIKYNSWAAAARRIYDGLENE